MFKTNVKKKWAQHTAKFKINLQMMDIWRGTVRFHIRCDTMFHTLSMADLIFCHLKLTIIFYSLCLFFPERKRTSSWVGRVRRYLGEVGGWKESGKNDNEIRKE